jgi:hypothetical protein
MSLIGILMLVAQIACAVHAGRTGRPFFWIFIIIFIPMFGMLAYLAVEILPELLRSRGARRAVSGMGKLLDPEKDYRAALRQVQISETVENKSQLAELCLATRRYDEAAGLYREILTGIHADDPDLLLGLARAEFGLERYAEVEVVLGHLRQANPDYRSADGHLLYARCLELQGKTEAAIDEYEAVAGSYPGQEAKCRYALLLKKVGREDEARRLFGEVRQAVELMPRYARRIQSEWYDLARRNLAT